MVKADPEETTQNAISDFSKLIDSMSDQPLEKEKLKNVFELIAEKADELKMPPKILAMFLLQAFITDIAPLLLAQKCSKCQENMQDSHTSIKKDESWKYLYA